MKYLLILLLICKSLYAIQAPYLISVNATSDTSIELAWRNNSIETEAFILLRKTLSDSNFKKLDSVSVNTTTYIDNTVSPSTKYYYTIIAYTQVELSDSSNIDSATTETTPFVNPSYGVSWDAVSKEINLSVINRSKYDINTSLYLSQDDGETLKVNDFSETVLSRYDTLKWSTSNVKFNAWHTYLLKISYILDTAIYYSKTVYTFEDRSRIPDYLKMINPDSLIRISDYPITFGKNLFAMYYNNNLIIAETNSLSSSFSLIDVSDPYNPIFEGYINGAGIPKEVSGKEHFIHSNHILVCTRDSKNIKYYKFLDSNIIHIGNMYHKNLFLMFGIVDDSTAIALLWGVNKIGCIGCSQWITVQFNDSGIIQNSDSMFGDIDEWQFNFNYVSSRLHQKKLYYKLDVFLGSIGVVDYFYGILDCSLSGPKLLDLNGNLPPGYDNFLSLPYIKDSIVIPSIGRKCFIDKKRKILLALYDTILTVYEYKEEPYKIGIDKESKYLTENRHVISYPNPFNPSTTISFPNPNKNVDITIYSIDGREVKFYAGIKDTRLKWNAFSQPSGIYIAKVNSGKRIFKKRLILVK